MGRSWSGWLKRRAAGEPERAVPPARRFVVGDIHGCARTFRTLVEAGIEAAGGDEIYLLGDLISKGPDSLGVLEYISELEHRDVRVTIIRGNHEEALLKARDRGPSKLRALLERNHNTALLDPEDDSRLDPRWDELISKSVYYLALPDVLLVHAGFDFSKKQPFSDTRSMLNLREIHYDAEAAGGRPIIYGHTRTPLSSIIEHCVNGRPTLPLDNCAVGATRKEMYKIAEYGNLCCLDIDRRTLFVQPNCDREEAGKASTSFSIAIQPARRTSKRGA
ncbi:MAG: metallophosphoesterase [Spirochaetales bacterium]|nr:metallophosphoesterase [Spirochaetales bacterium]